MFFWRLLILWVTMKLTPLVIHPELFGHVYLCLTPLIPLSHICNFHTISTKSILEFLNCGLEDE